MNMKPATREKEQDILNSIMQYLKLKGVFHYRNNVGAFQDSRGGFYRVGMPGAPDIIAVIHGYFVGIEVKRPDGKQSDHQKCFQKSLSEAGGIYFLVHSLDETVEAVEDCIGRLGLKGRAVCHVNERDG